MSNWMPDDPIDKPALVRAETATDLPAERVGIPEVHGEYGVFDSIVLVDGAAVSHRIEARYNTGNNNVVSVTWQAGDQRRRFIMGTTENIADPAYWKIDGVRPSVQGRDLLLTITGHQIQDSSPFRRIGCGWATVRLSGVWTPEPVQVSGGVAWPPYDPQHQTFADVPPGHPQHKPIEMLAGIGAISGYADGSFRPRANITREQYCKVTYLALGGGL